LKVFGVDLNFASAGDLQNSLNAYKSSTSSNYEFYEMEKTVITNMCCTIMELATYFCSGSVSDDRLFHHYALNIQKYTHFTSPIRRYADVIVHRLLALAIHDRPSKINMTTEKIQEQAEICNKKNKASKVAQELNSELFLGVFIRV
jgi:exoribonuclease R